MIREILRFNASARPLRGTSKSRSTTRRHSAEVPPTRTVSTASEFIEHYLVPMAAAIWSAEPRRDAWTCPSNSFVRFFKNHGLLQRQRSSGLGASIEGGSKGIRRTEDPCRAPRPHPRRAGGAGARAIRRDRGGRADSRSRSATGETRVVRLRRSSRATATRRCAMLDDPSDAAARRRARARFAIRRTSPCCTRTRP